MRGDLLLPDEIGPTETRRTIRHRTLLTMAVLGAAIVLAYLPMFVIRAFYVDGIRSMASAERAKGRAILIGTV